MRYAAVAIVVLEALALALAPSPLVGPATIAVGAIIIVLGLKRIAPRFAFALAGGATLGLVPTLGPLLPALALALFLVVAAAAHVLSSRSNLRPAAIPVRSRG
ncbi:MAG: hypothetical protein ACRDHF_11920 [Tepidiformaceae bacterium]